MQVSALSQSLGAQSLMGQLIVKVLGQANQMAQQQALVALQKNMENNAILTMSEAIGGIGENLDISA
jgi:hypothetical protein